VEKRLSEKQEISIIINKFALDVSTNFYWHKSCYFYTNLERRINRMDRLRRFFRDETGASAVEYGLLVALIAAVIVGAVTLLGGNLKATFDYIASIVLKP
jgi:pilus assembly protein Flp/PilA